MLPRCDPDKDEKPTPQKVLALCQGFEASFGKGCRQIDQQA